ncbi:MAG: hypothetical protein MJZ90_11870 [Bacteroidales bacterium]|nr:hypothetical protein [Bacteroidales bacterium]
MNITAIFNFENKIYKFSRLFEELDRNYDDESYAYFIEEWPNTENGIFEINLFKNNNLEGKIIEKGYVAVYDSTDKACPDELVNANIKFT